MDDEMDDDPRDLTKTVIYAKNLVEQVKGINRRNETIDDLTAKLFERAISNLRARTMACYAEGSSGSHIRTLMEAFREIEKEVEHARRKI